MLPPDRHHVQSARIGVAQDVGYRFLDQAVDRLRQQTVDFVQSGIDARGQFELRRLRTGILQQRVYTPLETELLDVKRSQPVEDAAIGVLQRFDRLQNALRRSLE